MESHFKTKNHGQCFENKTSAHKIGIVHCLPVCTAGTVYYRDCRKCSLTPWR